MGSKGYPALEVNLKTVEMNTAAVAAMLRERGVTLTGVVKGFNGLPRVVDAMVAAGCTHIASSRLDQLARLRPRYPELPLMLLRLPMLAEVEDLVRVADISLHSEWKTVEALNDAAISQGRRHGVVLMQDLGDLREGFFDAGELIDLAVHIETRLQGLILSGVGTNLGCYGAIKPTADNLGQLCQTAAAIEERIGRRLEIVSGGATSSIPLLLAGGLPAGINNLRIGEGILVNRDLPDFWQVNVPGLKADAFILKAQVVEVKDKPSHPVGEVFIDAFGNRPVYTDRGIRRRAVLAVGKQDLGDLDKLVPLTPGVEIVGGSSDHLIIDIQDCKAPVAVGDVLAFGLYYAPMLYLSGARGVRKIYRRK